MFITPPPTKILTYGVGENTIRRPMYTVHYKMCAPFCTGLNCTTDSSPSPKIWEAPPPKSLEVEPGNEASQDDISLNDNIILQLDDVIAHHQCMM